ncbi:MAG: metallophosphoesterase [Nitrososphaeraceae archaeon]
MPKIIVVSDQHLGYENSNAVDFKRFLEYVYSIKNDVESIVILGDFVDMWRRDASGVFLESSDIVSSLLTLKSANINLYFVAGNHDYHVLRLLNKYPFDFLKELVLPVAGGSLKCRFKHGWEYDLAQQPPIMEMLCHNMSDDTGGALSNLYSVLLHLKDHISGLSDLINYHGGKEGYIKHLMTKPEARLEPYLSDVEKKALSDVKSGERLVFGHTHKPFVSRDMRLVNSGSWVKDQETIYSNFNTFVDIDGNQVRLMQFKGINEIIDITSEKTKDV